MSLDACPFNLATKSICGQVADEEKNIHPPGERCDADDSASDDIRNEGPDRKFLTES
jgi:hypothetical protein